MRIGASSRPAVLPPALVVLGEGGVGSVWLLVLVVVVVLIVGARALLHRKRLEENASEEFEPLLVFPMRSSAPTPRAEMPGPIAPPVAAPTRMPAPAPMPIPMPAPYPVPVPASQPAAHDESSETIRFDPALEATIQLLPGRLVVEHGADHGREYRFIRSRDQDVPEVTIGRAPGPTGRHVQLSGQTVSRLHARLRYRDRRWSIVNASDTNPVRINGREVTEDHEVPLSDGDRIQLGEVELRFLETRT